MTVPTEEASANYVPAAAVIRKRQALFGIIGRKGVSRRFRMSTVKVQGSTVEGQWKLRDLRLGEAGGILHGAVKCVDMRENTRGEGGRLDQF